MNKNDARVRYTQAAIETAFFELLENYPLEKITVTELCLHAGINRATFYKHYEDVPALLEAQINQTIGEVTNILSEKTDRDFRVCVMSVLQHVQDHAKRYRLLHIRGGGTKLHQKILTVVYNYAYPMVTGKTPLSSMEEARALVDFVTGGSAAILTRWIMDDMTQPISVVADRIIAMSEGATKSMICSQKVSKEA